MAEIPQKHDFLTSRIQNSVIKVKQFVRKYYITWLIELANKLWHKKILDFILCYVVKNCLVLLRNFVNKSVQNSI